MTHPDPQPTPDSPEANPAQANPAAPPADATTPPPASLEDVLADSWRTFWNRGQVPAGWAAHTAAAVAEHLHRPTTPPSTVEHSGLRRELTSLRRRIRELLADAVAAEHLDLDLANDILDTCDIPGLPRRWRVRLGVPILLEVAAVDAEDAYAQAEAAVYRAVADLDGLDVDLDDVVHDDAEPGEFDPLDVNHDDLP